MTSKSIKAVGQVGVLTTVSRFLGLVREVFIANLLGTTALSDAFTIAFVIPNLCRRLFAEGTIVNFIVPVFKEVEKKSGRHQALEFAANCFWMIAFFSFCFCILFFILNPLLLRHGLAPGFDESLLSYTTALSRIMTGYLFFIFLAAVYQGVLNSQSIFWVSSFTPLLLNVSIIVGALMVAPYHDSPAIILSICVLLGGFLQFIFQCPFAYRKGFRLFVPINIQNPYLKQLLKKSLPSIFGSGVYQINIVVGTAIASWLYSGAASSLKFSNRLIEFLIGIVVVSLTTVLLPTVSEKFLERDFSSLSKSLEEMLKMISFVTLPIVFGTIALNREIISLLFERGQFDSGSVNLVGSALIFHILGLGFIASNRILLAYYQASQNVNPILYYGFAAVVLNLILAIALSEFIGHAGIALAMTISQVFHFLLLFSGLKLISISTSVISILKSKSAWLSLQIGLVMYLLLISLKRINWVEQQSIYTKLPLCVLLGASFYLGFSLVFRNRELLSLLAKLGLTRTNKMD